MARVRSLTGREAPWVARISYWFGGRVAAKLTGRRSAPALEPYAVAAHRPWIMQAQGFFELALMWSRRLDPRVKELARMRVGTIHGCPW